MTLVEFLVQDDKSLTKQICVTKKATIYHYKTIAIIVPKIQYYPLADWEVSWWLQKIKVN